MKAFPVRFRFWSCRLWQGLAWACVAMFALETISTTTHAATTIYVNEHYEVRDHDEPVKYVFKGDARVACITGSLTANTRIQRLRLNPGWNLCSVAVGGMPLPRRLPDQGTDLITAAYRWGAVIRRWITVQTNETLAAGTVLWLRTTTNAVISLQGECPEPANQIVGIGGSFHPSAGMNALRLPTGSALEEGQLGQATYDAAQQLWHTQHPAVPWGELAHPTFIGPGQAVFLQTDTPAELEVPDRASRITYYHQDHLGSSSAVADSRGELMEETAFYPHGIPRHEHRLREVEQAYAFSQKERDRESGLHYFEARYLSGGLARFVSIDPKYANPSELSGEDFAGFLGTPQKLNLYAYAASNPLKYWDPTGLDEKESPGLVDTIDTMGDRLGFLSDVNKLDGPGMFFDIIGVTIKTGKAIDNPTAPRIIVAGYEATKAAATKYVPPLGLTLQGLDLVGIGPGTFFDWGADAYDKLEEQSKENEQMIADLKATSKAYAETAKINQRITASLKAETAQLKKEIAEKDALIKNMDERLRKSDEVLKRFRARNAR